MLSNYQYLPASIDPIVLIIGSFSVRWYALMYLIGAAAVYGLLRWRIKAKEGDYDANLIGDLVAYSILGIVLGGRLGYVLLYDISYYFSHPLAIISPVDFSTGTFTGIYGMSYFGGLIGALLAVATLIRKQNISFWKVADFIVPAIPAGYFFGRIGNFINGELYGRPTDKIWGMYFPDDASGLLRHPSQLYEAFFEGLVLFIILWSLRNNKSLLVRHGLLPVYLFGYAFFRFCIEFLREPDVQSGLMYGFTVGQLLAIWLILTAIVAFFWKKKKRVL